MLKTKMLMRRIMFKSLKKYCKNGSSYLSLGSGKVLMLQIFQSSKKALRTLEMYFLASSPNDLHHCIVGLSFKAKKNLKFSTKCIPSFYGSLHFMWQLSIKIRLFPWQSCFSLSFMSFMLMIVMVRLMKQRLFYTITLIIHGNVNFIIG